VPRDAAECGLDDTPTPAELSTFASDPSKYAVITGLTNGKVQLTINNTAGPFKSLLVRQAVNSAINKQAVIQVVSAGKGVAIGTDSVPSDPYYINLANLYPCNPAKAKQLLAQAGYPNGFSTTLTLPPYFYATLAAPVIQSELAAVGIKVTIKNVAFPLWLSQVFEGGDFDLTIIDQAEARDIGNYGTTGYYWHYAGTGKAAAQLAAANARPATAGTRPPQDPAAGCSARLTKAVPSAATWASRDRQAAGTLQARAYRVYRQGPAAVYPTIQVGIVGLVVLSSLCEPCCLPVGVSSIMRRLPATSVADGVAKCRRVAGERSAVPGWRAVPFHPAL
jgi:ABC-type transport system substrate-binding protein